jgi:hypothetical protein
VADIDFAPVEMDGGDESVFVSANVEHDAISNFIRRREGGTQGLKAREVVPPHDFEPSGKGMFAVGVLCPKLSSWASGIRLGRPYVL